jgi:hypothetical protein
VSLNEVTLTLDAYNGVNVPVGVGTAFLVPTAAVAFPSDSVYLWQVPIPVSLVPPSGAPANWLPTVTLVASDNSGGNPTGWGWTISFQAGQGAPGGFTFFLDYADGASQNLSAQVPVYDAATMLEYLSLTGGQLQGALAPAVFGLTDAATVQINAADGNDFPLTLTQNTQLLAPLNPKEGQKIFLYVAQGAGAPWTLSYASGWVFASSLPAPSLSTVAGDTDVLGWVYRSALGGWLFLGSVEGYT